MYIVTVFDFQNQGTKTADLSEFGEALSEVFFNEALRIMCGSSPIFGTESLVEEFKSSGMGDLNPTAPIYIWPCSDGAILVGSVSTGRCGHGHVGHAPMFLQVRPVDGRLDLGDKLSPHITDIWNQTKQSVSMAEAEKVLKTLGEVFNGHFAYHTIMDSRVRGEESHVH